MFTFVTGGLRSGKSEYGLRRASELGPPPWLYVAPHIEGDDELKARLARHRRDQEAAWHLHRGARQARRHAARRRRWPATAPPSSIASPSGCRTGWRPPTTPTADYDLVAEVEALRGQPLPLDDADRPRHHRDRPRLPARQRARPPPDQRRRPRQPDPRRTRPVGRDDGQRRPPPPALTREPARAARPPDVPGRRARLQLHDRELPGDPARRWSSIPATRRPRSSPRSRAPACAPSRSSTRTRTSIT